MSKLCMPEVNDNYESYYLEKMWEMLPAYYREEDGLASNPDVLRSIISIMASQAARIRRSQDQLWQDQSIEHSQDWTVPYIGDLLATRLLSALNQRGQRIDVAKTIYYRRRKGTLGVLEELISDITGWEGKAIESFQQLARTRHGLDPEIPTNRHQPAMTPLLGALTSTQKGGTADFRSTHGSDLIGTAFDEYFYTPEFRQAKGKKGRNNIPKLVFYIYRLLANPLYDVTPFQLDQNRYVFDPSGRETLLFSARNRESDWHDWRSILRWELPAPISCHLLNHAEYVIDNGLLLDLENELGVSESAIHALRQLQGEVHPSEARLLQMIRYLNEPELETEAAIQFILRTALIEHCAKQQLFPDSISVYRDSNLIDNATMAAADLSLWLDGGSKKEVLIDPERGFLLFLGDAPDDVRVAYHYGFPMELGAGAHSRSQVEFYEADTELSGGGAINDDSLHNEGVSQINDNKTYGPLSDKLKIRDLALQAANGSRPYIIMEANWVLRADDENEEDAIVRLDGLWLGSNDSDNEVIIRGNGDYELVKISHCTFDPGGSVNVAGDIIWPVRLVIEAKVEKLVIQNSILGQIEVRNEGSVESLQIEDSIVDVAAHVELTNDEDPDRYYAILAPFSTVEMNRCTILGKLLVNRLYASEVILSEQPIISDTQQGCFRFSAAPQDSRLPSPYESVLYDISNQIFSSTIFGQPYYARLNEYVGAVILEGAENGSEMGVYSTLIEPIKRDNLLTKINEYMPFGLIPYLVFET